MSGRAIVHLDLDCFYAQVESRRLGLGSPPWTSKDATPVAVRQWDGLIAVNYAARASGVKRFMRPAEASQLCPGIHLVHVETLGGQTASSGGGAAEDPGNGTGLEPDRRTQKACLRRYRDASEEVFAIFARYAKRCEMASIDEAYLDLTAEAEKWLSSEQGKSLGRLEALAQGVVCAAGFAADPEKDGLLLAAWVLVEALRREVQAETGFTVSAGIAENKLCAKLGSACHKPDQQTLVPRAGVHRFMETVALRDLRGLGGKLGERVRAATGLQPESPCAELMQVPVGELQRHLGEAAGAFVWRLARGIDAEDVVSNLKRKQFLSFKSFQPAVSTMEALQPWLASLAEEVAERLRGDPERRARALVVHHRGQLDESHARNWMARRTSELTKTVSRTCPFPSGPPSGASIAAAAARVLREKIEAPCPCTRLAIGATDFEEVTRGPQITSFFARAAAAPAVSSEALELPVHGADVAAEGASEGLAPVEAAAHPKLGSVGADAANRTQQVGDSARLSASGGHLSSTAVAPASLALPKKGAEVGGDAQVANFHRASRLHFLGTWRERFERWQRTNAEGTDLIQPLVLQNLLADLASAAMPSEGTIRCEGSSRGEGSWAHLDMDCFFASVATRDLPEGDTMPTAVTTGVGKTSEICSANYAARRWGVTTALWTVGRALEVLPTLRIIPVTEELLRAVEVTWQQVYQLLVVACSGCPERVLMRSCDESSLWVEGVQILPWARALRAAVHAQTRCACSIGAGPSQVVAKLAVKDCKPDGFKSVLVEDVQTYIASVPTASLPQVGRQLSAKLQERGLTACADIRAYSKAQMRELFGAKGEMVWMNAHGEDYGQSTQPAQRKSMSAEINWGVRPQDRAAALQILGEVAQQLAERLAAADASAAHLTLKLKIAVPGWVEPPWKVGGHGICDDVSRSAALHRLSREQSVLRSTGEKLFDELAPPPSRIRGLGLAARLPDRVASGAGGSGLQRWLRSSTATGGPSGAVASTCEASAMCVVAFLEAPVFDVVGSEEEEEEEVDIQGSFEHDEGQQKGHQQEQEQSPAGAVCPVCGLHFPVASIDAHVNAHFDGAPLPAAPPPGSSDGGRRGSSAAAQLLGGSIAGGPRSSRRQSVAGQEPAAKVRRTLLDFVGPLARPASASRVDSSADAGMGHRSSNGGDDDCEILD